MPITIYIDDDTPILVELKEVSGEQDASLVDNILEHSTEALNSAMAAIVGMARRTYSTVKAIPLAERPHEVAVEFGLKLTTDANAFVANAGVESQINVTLKWHHDAPISK